MFLIDGSIHLFDSLAYNSIKNLNFRSISSNDTPTKYSLVFTFYLMKEDSIYPFINDLNLDPKSKNLKLNPAKSNGVRPKLIHKATPDYPDLARRAGIEGRVVIAVDINYKGDVVATRVLRSPDKLLSNASIAAALKCKFSTNNDMGKTEIITMSIPFDFRVKR